MFWQHNLCTQDYTLGNDIVGPHKYHQVDNIHNHEDITNLCDYAQKACSFIIMGGDEVALSWFKHILFIQLTNNTKLYYGRLHTCHTSFTHTVG